MQTQHRESLAPPNGATTTTPTLAEQLALERANLPPRAVVPAFQLSAADDRRYVDDRSRTGLLRGAKRFRCVAVVPSCMVLPVPGGKVLQRGINEFSAFEDEIELIREKYVVDDAERDRQRMAREEYLRLASVEIRKQLIENTTGGRERWEPVPASTIAKMIETDDPDPDFQDAMRHWSYTTSHSAQSAYARMFGADGHTWKPIDRLDVVEDLGVPPSTTEAGNAALASTIVGTLQATANTQMTPELLGAAIVNALREAGLAKGGK